jgi:hypothetical protein
VCFAAAGLAVSAFVSTQKLSKQHEVTKTGLAAEEENRRLAKEAKKKKASSAGGLAESGSEEVPDKV